MVDWLTHLEEKAKKTGLIVCQEVFSGYKKCVSTTSQPYEISTDERWENMASVKIMIVHV